MRFIVCSCLLLFSSFFASASPTVARLIFNNTEIILQISASHSGSSQTKFTAVKKESEKQEFEFKTPQYSSQPITRIPVSLIENFQGETTLRADIKANGGGSNPTKEKIKHGYLYYWITSTEGSSTYFYLQSPMNKAIALKVGPLAGTIAKDIDFNWDKARWKVMSKPDSKNH